MTDKIHKYITIALIVCVVIIVGYLYDNRSGNLIDNSNFPLSGRSSVSFDSEPASTAGDGTPRQTIFSGSAILDRIAIGETASGSTLSIFSAASPSDSAAIFSLDGAAQGIYEMGMYFANGIYATVSASNKAVFIYTPK